METNEPGPGPSGPFASEAEVPPAVWEPFHVVARTGLDGMAALAVWGELDITAERSLREAVGTVISRDAPDVLLDLSAVTFCDTSGLKVLHLCGEDARTLGGTVVLTGLSERMLWLLKVSGLERVFTPVVRVPGRSGLPYRAPSGRGGPFPSSPPAAPRSPSRWTVLRPPPWGAGQSPN
ncbi:STAS domain-containing protein [Streptosporangium sp. NPDC051022]|uniref:STAS domain-containing protein n=1 Tax=Streptosporangium sp. NPDC051022 TaxID=3155752 RepID=UPI0034497CC8